MKSICLLASMVVSIAPAQTEFTIDFSKQAQVIENIGSSTGMHGDYISKHWEPETVDSIADLLFSRELDDAGRPKGIGLSSFRIQIGGGGEGEESGIRTPYRRTGCFLRPDGSYDWNHDRGVMYWREKARQYEIPAVMGYLNSPPVYFTENGYTFKTDKVFTSNLKPQHYGDYAEFLMIVAQHFQTLGVPFDYISPVNEPQWDWSFIPGKAKQEGTPWTNEQIARLARMLDAEFRQNKISTKILIPETADYHALYEPLPNRMFAEATDQIRAFWSRNSPDYIGNLQSVEKAVAGHAYFSDSSIDKMIRTRSAITDVMEETSSNLRFWQTEYSLLGDGWTGGLPVSSVDETTAALLLARNVHVDFTVANAAAWQWWSSTEPKVGRVPRFCLIECDADGKQNYRATKLLWALGHYSRFIRPGMVRVEVESDTELKHSLQNVMASAYFDEEQNRWVMVLINFSDMERTAEYKTRMLPRSGSDWKATGFLTTKDKDMQRFDVVGNQFALPPKSIVTIVSGIQ